VSRIINEILVLILINSSGT